MARNLPPIRSAMFDQSGVMTQPWTTFFTNLYQNSATWGSSQNIDDISPPRATEVATDSIAQLGALLAMYAARNDELEKQLNNALLGPVAVVTKDDTDLGPKPQAISKDDTDLAPRLGYTPVNVSGDKLHGTMTVFKGEADRPPLIFQDGTLLTTPVTGALEYSDGHWYLTNGARHVISTSNGIKTSTTTVTNTVTETTIYSYTLAANELHTDEHILLTVSGVYSNASAADDWTLNLKVGGVTLHTVSRVGGNVTDAGWCLNWTGTVRTSGASGTFVDMIQLFDQSTIYTASETGTHSIDTTTTVDVVVTVTWANAKAGNLFYCKQGMLKFDH